MAMIKIEEPRCGSCREINGDVTQGFVYCHWLNQSVYAESIMCPHGRDLEECF